MQERIPPAGSPCIRQRIVQAAIRLHRKIGFRKTTVADIARGTSMSPANVYRFFASKQAIEEAVVADLFEQIRRDRLLDRLLRSEEAVDVGGRHRRSASDICDGGLSEPDLAVQSDRCLYDPLTNARRSVGLRYAFLHCLGPQ